MTKFILVRHGQSKANEGGFLAGITDVPLSTLGEKQAKAVSEYISKAVSSGLFKGLGDSRFGVGSYITRQDIALILSRGASIKGISLDDNKIDISFNDVKDISTYALDAVSELYSNRIISGTPEGNFNPGSFATRAEAAKMIYELLKKGGNI